jgi:hypothetical protein
MAHWDKVEQVHISHPFENALRAGAVAFARLRNCRTQGWSGARADRPGSHACVNYRATQVRYGFTTGDAALARAKMPERLAVDPDCC